VPADSNGNLTATGDALAHSATFTYDGSGQLKSKMDARGDTTNHGCDAHAYVTVVSLAQQVGELVEKAKAGKSRGSLK
jgi:YD repeat-containing protein